jgi:hypothetical protein
MPRISDSKSVKEKGKQTSLHATDFRQLSVKDKGK